MDPEHVEIFRRLSRPLEPLPTDAEPLLRSLADIRTVLFDIYGTLVISASGEVGTADESDGGHGAALSAALEAVSAPLKGDGASGVELLVETIGAHHARARTAGVATAEVRIDQVWGDVVTALAAAGRLPVDPQAIDLPRLAVEYEARVNPAWPMPGAADCLARLAEAGIVLGIVSNAQAYTRPLLTALFGQTPEGLGFDPQLQYYSYRKGVAKPGRAMYEQARAALAEQGIEAEQTLYVGNDMRNDVGPAHDVGFRTALFAGDARSLRRRDDDPRLAALVPDLVLTHLDQLPGCLIDSR